MSKENRSDSEAAKTMDAFQLTNYNPKDAKIKSALEKLSKEYKIAKSYEEAMRKEVENYEMLYRDELELLKTKEELLGSIKLRVEEVKHEEEVIEKEVEEEKRRVEEIHKAEEIERAMVLEKSEEARKIEAEIREIIEEDKRVKDSRVKVLEAKRLLESAKIKFDTAQREADEELKRILRSEGFGRVTKSTLERAKELITEKRPTEDVKQSEEVIKDVADSVNPDVSEIPAIESNDLTNPIVEERLEIANAEISDTSPEKNIERIESQPQNLTETNSEAEISMEDKKEENPAPQEESENKSDIVTGQTSEEKKESLFSKLKHKILKESKDEDDELKELEERFNKIRNA